MSLMKWFEIQINKNTSIHFRALLLATFLNEAGRGQSGFCGFAKTLGVCATRHQFKKRKLLKTVDERMKDAFTNMGNHQSIRMLELGLLRARLQPKIASYF